MIVIADFILEFFVFALSVLFLGIGLFIIYIVISTIWQRYVH
jgi:hypothetical protein